MDTIGEYLDLVSEVRRGEPAQREGQAYYNAARMKWPGLLDNLPVESDPFSDDKRLPSFLAWLDQARLEGRLDGI
ncbi:hypothetical protein [Mycobacterium sp. 29Ha]|uniref:hypothetical protein n=1 Tax=Mycobacterium sp. 29Ha TaxID=2939268 RepID=UPI0029394497|nr:hypothetical protein [Mycobacterium sp. 29Ha]MDV3136621.1 hypothetical protein [Mycobacterium sp. 29Ha]